MDYSLAPGLTGDQVRGLIIGDAIVKTVLKWGPGQDQNPGGWVATIYTDQGCGLPLVKEKGQGRRSWRDPGRALAHLRHKLGLEAVRVDMTDW
ncbi:MAG: hypothetical protein ABW131_09600 [Candidatus Sedimenticola sp. 6PFRAG5]